MSHGTGATVHIKALLQVNKDTTSMASDQLLAEEQAIQARVEAKKAKKQRQKAKKRSQSEALPDSPELVESDTEAALPSSSSTANDLPVQSLCDDNKQHLGTAPMAEVQLQPYARRTPSPIPSFTHSKGQPCTPDKTTQSLCATVSRQSGVEAGFAHIHTAEPSQSSSARQSLLFEDDHMCAVCGLGADAKSVLKAAVVHLPKDETHGKSSLNNPGGQDVSALFCCPITKVSLPNSGIHVGCVLNHHV